jgi:hypothetical protein
VWVGSGATGCLRRLGRGACGGPLLSGGGDVTSLLPHDESDKFELRLQHDGPRAAVTEQLRLALRDYRELAERLLRL